MSDELASFITVNRDAVRLERALKRVAEVTQAYNTLGQDIPAADIELAMQLEES